MLLFPLLTRHVIILGVLSEDRMRIRSESMKKYVCDVCGYIYDPEKGDPEGGINPGTSFEDLPDDWICPECGAGKDEFSPEE